MNPRLPKAERLRRVRASKRLWRARRREYYNGCVRDWKKANPDRVKLSRERQMERLPKWYVVQCLMRCSGLARHELTPDLICLKRIEMRLKRRLKHESIKRKRVECEAAGSN